MNYRAIPSHKCNVAAVNQLILPLSPRDSLYSWRPEKWGNVWVCSKPFHYVLDPGKALSDLAPWLHLSFTWLSRDTHTHMQAGPARQNTACVSPFFSSFSHIKPVRWAGRSQKAPQTKLTLISGWRSPAAVFFCFFFAPVKLRSVRIQGEMLKCQMESWHGSRQAAKWLFCSDPVCAAQTHQSPVATFLHWLKTTKFTTYCCPDFFETLEKFQGQVDCDSNQK